MAFNNLMDIMQGLGLGSGSAGDMTYNPMQSALESMGIHSVNPMGIVTNPAAAQQPVMTPGGPGGGPIVAQTQFPLAPGSGPPTGGGARRNPVDTRGGGPAGLPGGPGQGTAGMVASPAGAPGGGAPTDLNTYFNQQYQAHGPTYDPLTDPTYRQMAQAQAQSNPNMASVMNSMLGNSEAGSGGYNTGVNELLAMYPQFANQFQAVESAQPGDNSWSWFPTGQALPQGLNTMAGQQALAADLSGHGQYGANQGTNFLAGHDTVTGNPLVNPMWENGYTMQNGKFVATPGATATGEPQTGGNVVARTEGAAGAPGSIPAPSGATVPQGGGGAGIQAHPASLSGVNGGAGVPAPPASVGAPGGGGASGYYGSQGNANLGTGASLGGYPTNVPQMSNTYQYTPLPSEYAGNLNGINTVGLALGLTPGQMSQNANSMLTNPGGYTNQQVSNYSPAYQNYMTTQEQALKSFLPNLMANDAAAHGVLANSGSVSQDLLAQYAPMMMGQANNLVQSNMASNNNFSQALAQQLAAIAGQRNPYATTPPLSPVGSGSGSGSNSAPPINPYGNLSDFPQLPDMFGGNGTSGQGGAGGGGGNGSGAGAGTGAGGGQAGGSNSNTATNTSGGTAGALGGFMPVNGGQGIVQAPGGTYYAPGGTTNIQGTLTDQNGNPITGLNSLPIDPSQYPAVGQTDPNTGGYGYTAGTGYTYTTPTTNYGFDPYGNPNDYFYTNGSGQQLDQSGNPIGSLPNGVPTPATNYGFNPVGGTSQDPSNFFYNNPLTGGQTYGNTGSDMSGNPYQSGGYDPYNTGTNPFPNTGTGTGGFA